MTLDEIFALILTQFPSFLGFVYALLLQSRTIAKLDEQLRIERAATAVLYDRLMNEAAGNSKSEEMGTGDK